MPKGSIGTEEHSALAAEALFALRSALGDRPCRVHTSDLRVYVESVGLATFPDGSVICGDLVQHPPSPVATALNPTILLEVTSDSSEEYDTGDKLRRDVDRTHGDHRRSRGASEPGRRARSRRHLPPE